jgi:hypothetical protein
MQLASSSLSSLVCVLLGGGCRGSPAEGRMGVCAVWVPVPPALGHDSTCLLEDLESKKGQVILYIAFLFMTAMLTLWVPRRGVPKQCFATDAL